MNLERELDMARNMFGASLCEDARARLAAAVADPCEATWDDAHTILLTPRISLWAAVIEVDPSFAFIKGPVTRWVDDPRRKLGGYSVPVSGWSRTPTAEVIRQAIAYATH
jgi:hypothetical protein